MSARCDAGLPADHRVSLFSLRTGSALAGRICQHLGIAPGQHEERDFEDGEHKIRPLESVRERDVYVVESLFGDAELSVNDKLVRVLVFCGALKDAGAHRVTCVAPYLCYARKDRRTKARDPVTTRYVASMIEAVGVDRVVTMDVHNPAAYQNGFRIPAEHVTAAPMFVTALRPLVGERGVVVVSPDAGGAKRAEAFRQAFEGALGRPVGLAFLEKFRSEGAVRSGAVIGDVADRVAVIVDDLISSGTTVVRAATACKQRGARATYAAATHGVFSGGASDTLRDSSLDRLVITDTIVPRRLEPSFVERRVDVLDCAPLLAAAIARLHTGGSLVELTALPLPAQSSSLAMRR